MFSQSQCFKGQYNIDCHDGSVCGEDDLSWCVFEGYMCTLDIYFFVIFTSQNRSFALCSAPCLSSDFSVDPNFQII